MRQSLLGTGAVLVALLMAGCSEPSPSSESITQPVVLTLQAANTDFGKYQTFYLRPEIRDISDSGTSATLDAKTAQPILNQTQQNLTARGYRSVNQKADADLAVEMIHVTNVSTAVTCYSWWDPYYWGYPAYAYYPYYGSCDSSTWKSNLLATVIVDVSRARSTPTVSPNAVVGDAGARSTAGTDGAVVNPSQQVGGIWFSGIYGVDLSSVEITSAIDEAFNQSPYLAAAKH